jgi:outer membrane receptor protein involved in Fe transport
VQRHHFYRLNPRGGRGDEEKGATILANLTHALGARTFYEIRAAYKFNELVSNLFDDPFDPRYIDPQVYLRPVILEIGANQFSKAGTDLARFERSTTSWIGKLDLTSQITDRHQVKTGVEVQFDKVFLEDLTLVPERDATGKFRVKIEDPSTPTHELITRRPFTFAAYLQDKIEYESLIINVGLRFDSFNPKGKVPVDPEDPNVFNPFKLKHIFKDTNGDGVISLSEQNDANRYTLQERESFWYRDTEVKYQLSPRLGVAYPITDRGVIHFSYGIFQQIPDYEQLYRKDQLKVTDATGTQGPFGNPDLDPQRTTMYELGLQQQLTEDLGIDITGFYRDIRDWVSTGAPTPTARADVKYVRKINRDFANVRGITLAANKRLSHKFSFNVDYTFQLVEGTNSTTEEEYFSQVKADEPTRQLTPLNWDQRHTFNATLFVGANDWGISLIERFNSGQPYTPSLVTGTRVGRNIISGLEENSRRKPTRLTVDLTAFKNLNIGVFELQLFARAFNIFDIRNPVNVFGDSGEADFTFQEQQAVQADPTWFVRPDFFSAPREVQLGARISF